MLICNYQFLLSMWRSKVYDNDLYLIFTSNEYNYKSFNNFV